MQGFKNQSGMSTPRGPYNTCVGCADVMVMRRNAVLAQQWRNGVKMMAAAANSKAMNHDMHLPQEWSY